MRPLPDVIRLRASALAELFDDSLRWRSRAIDGIHTPTSGRSHLGTAVHFGTADFDRQRLLADGRPDAADAVGAFKQYFHNDAGVHWTDIKKLEAEKIGMRLVADYCTEISEQFEWVAVEATCEPLVLTMPNGVVFEITGTTDRVYRLGSQYGIADFKSGARIIGEDGEVEVDEHGPQLGTYELLESIAENATGFKITLPAFIMGFSTASAQIKWRFVDNPRTLLFGDTDHVGYLEAAARIIKENLFVGNPRSMLCSERYCGIYNSCFYRIGRTK